MPAGDTVAGSVGSGGTDMAGSMGFIGLGRTGRPTAARPLRKGFDVLAHDIDPDAVAAGALRSGTQSVLNEYGRET